MAKIIRELLALLWKLIRTYVLKWLKSVMSKVVVFSAIILGLVLVLAFVFGRCLVRALKIPQPPAAASGAARGCGCLNAFRRVSVVRAGGLFLRQFSAA